MRLSVTGELNSVGWDTILEACHPCLTGRDNILDVDFSPMQWVSPSGVAPLAGLFNLLRSRSVDLRISDYPQSSLCSYLCRMDFFDSIGVDSPCSMKRQSGDGRFLEVTELESSQIEADTREKLSGLFEGLTEVCEEAKSSFMDACGELVSNTRHAYASDEIGLPHALIHAQYYPSNSYVDVCICDMGIGIRASLSRTDPSGFTSDLDAINAALARGNRDASGGGAGLGLATLESYVKRNGGILAIRSGTARKMLRRTSVDTSSTLPYWPGTIVGFRVLVNEPTNLSQIWRRMAG